MAARSSLDILTTIPFLPSEMRLSHWSISLPLFQEARIVVQEKQHKEEIEKLRAETRAEFTKRVQQELKEELKEELQHMVERYFKPATA